MSFRPRPLPAVAKDLCDKLQAPPRLVAHLTLVHDAAIEIVAELRLRFPTLSLNRGDTPVPPEAGQNNLPDRLPGMVY